MSKGRESTPHIGIFGRRNIGKSSIINRLAGYELAIVSDTPGTTTDPVRKTIEIGGIGPVVLVDTAGIDDEGALGARRVARSLQVLKAIDMALLVIGRGELGPPEESLLEQFRSLALPFVIVNNKTDLSLPPPEDLRMLAAKTGMSVVPFSALHDPDTEDLVRAIRAAMPGSAWVKPPLLGDLISYGDLVLLITPIDIEAPEGRMILPQVQAIRDILDNDAVAVVVKEKELDALLRRLQPRPALAVTDSQVFLKAAASVPPDIPLTSFSIMLARFKGDFEHYLQGTPAISSLADGDRILILESCTHHVSCDDIGRTKIPRWLSNYSGKRLEFDVVAGMGEVPRPITDYALVVQCGGCVLTQKQVVNRLREAVEAGVPVTNYGMAIAWMHGIYERAVAPFAEVGKDGRNYL